MYIVPWQIFVLGCFFGIFISVITILAIVLRVATRGGVTVEHKIVEEEDDNGEC